MIITVWLIGVGMVLGGLVERFWAAPFNWTRLSDREIGELRLRSRQEFNRP